MAVGDPTFIPVNAGLSSCRRTALRTGTIEGLPLGTRGGLLIKDNFPLDAEYQINIVLLRNVLGYMKGLEWPIRLKSPWTVSAYSSSPSAEMRTIGTPTQTSPRQPT
jgi:hypothetical protein